MTRSLFFAFFLRLTIAMAFVVAIRSWIVPHGWVLASLLVLAWASLSAYMLVRSVRSSILPLQTAAATLAKGPVTAGDHPVGTLAANFTDCILEGGYSDFDSLARALRRTSREVQRALNETTASRHELEAMIDSLQDAVVAVDTAGRIQWSNQCMQRLMPSWGGSPAGRVTVRVGHALVQTIRDPDVLDCVRAAVEQRTFCQRRSTLLVPGRIFEINASPMPSGGAVALIHDVTRIEQVERTQREFVANVSHELRTPLTSISGYVETLIDHEQLSPQAASFLSTILKNASRMHRLTEDLLTMARIESPEHRLHPVPIAAETLVRDAVQALAGLVQDTDASIEITGTCSDQVLADPDAALQVLSNLIENAIKYGRNRLTGESRVLISTSAILDPVPAVEFRIQDLGPGIASEHLHRLFERFYRVDKARSLETGGTGLGLSIARHIVEAQGGEIRVESELNAGSTFIFYLPKVQDVAS